MTGTLPYATADVDVFDASDLEDVRACPACGNDAFDALLPGAFDPRRPDGRRWDEQRCRRCRSAFVSPRPTPATIGRAYEGAYYTHEAPTPVDAWPTSTRGAALRERLLKGYVNRRFGYALQPATRAGAVVVPLLPGARGMGSNHVRHLDAPAPGGRLLDIGCGNGSFLVRMRAAGWDVAGLEPDPAARAFAESAGLTVSEGPLTTGLFPPESFDAVTMNHVIEHLHEPREVLREIVRVLRPGGTVWVATPNGAALGLARYERRWWPLDPPRHLVLFTPDALRHAFLEAGFAEIVRPPSALLATRWTYRVSSAFARGEADPFGFPGIPRRDLLAAVIADLRTLVRAQDGEELVLGARKAG